MKTIEVVAAIIHQDNKILATQRGYGDYKGWWEFPGGKMEEGETEEQAIIREIREELDVEIAVERKVCTVEYDYPQFHLRMHCFWFPAYFSDGYFHLLPGEKRIIEVHSPSAGAIMAEGYNVENTTLKL